MLNVGVDTIFVTLSRALAMLLDCLMKRPRPTLRILLCETGSTINIWLAPYKWLVGGPERGVIETIILSVLWLQVRKVEGGSLCESPSAT